MLALAVAGGVSACESPASPGSLQEWAPSDHRSSDDDKLAAQTAARQAPSGNDVPQLVDLAWRQQCTACHGTMGKGDGQMGAMLHAPDLTSDDVAKVPDAQLAAIIKRGKDKMPAFNLPDPVIEGLVARIHQLQGRPQ